MCATTTSAPAVGPDAASDSAVARDERVALVIQAAEHPRPLNPLRTQLLALARKDPQAAETIYDTLCTIAGYDLQDHGSNGYGHCFDHTVETLRRMGLIARGSERALDAAMGHVARVTAGLPPATRTSTAGRLVADDPVRAVTVAYALCRARNWAV